VYIKKKQFLCVPGISRTPHLLYNPLSSALELEFLTLEASNINNIRVTSSSSVFQTFYRGSCSSTWLHSLVQIRFPASFISASRSATTNGRHYDENGR
jgi:hypothetical protein